MLIVLIEHSSQKTARSKLRTITINGSANNY